MAFTPTFEEYLWSHVRTPWELAEIYSPMTPWEDQETIDYRTEQVLYKNIDLAIAGVGLGFSYWYTGSMYQATNSLTFYRIASQMRNIGVIARATPTMAALAGPMLVGFAATSAAIENAPEHERPSLWQSVSQALTGTGPGTGGWQY